MHPKRDYAQANGAGSRGINLVYFLEEGMIYYISSPVSWTRTDKYYAMIQDGTLIRLTRDEAWKIVKHQSALTF
jgi:hypothetical protein